MPDYQRRQRLLRELLNVRLVKRHQPSLLSGFATRSIDEIFVPLASPPSRPPSFLPSSSPSPKQPYLGSRHFTCDYMCVTDTATETLAFKGKGHSAWIVTSMWEAPWDPHPSRILYCPARTRPTRKSNLCLLRNPFPDPWLPLMTTALPHHPHLHCHCCSPILPTTIL